LAHWLKALEAQNGKASSSARRFALLVWSFDSFAPVTFKLLLDPAKPKRVAARGATAITDADKTPDTGT
jgi:hypothetical protein